MSNPIKDFVSKYDMRNIRFFKKISKYLLVLLFPLVFTIFLYPPVEKEVFSTHNYNKADFKIEDLFHKQPSISSIAADVFSVSIFLDWYKVTIKNNSAIIDPYCLQEEPSTLFLSFWKGDPRLYSYNLKETTEQIGGYSASGPGHPTYYIKTGEEAFFIAPSSETYSIDGGLMFGGDCKLRMDHEFVIGETTFDFSIVLEPYWKAWLLRLFVLYIFWAVLLSSLISLWSWLRMESISTNR